MNTLLAGCVAALAMAVGVIGWKLGELSNHPPRLIEIKEGFPLWITSVEHRLRTDVLRCYLKTVIERLKTIEPGVYDLSDLAEWISPRVLREFYEYASRTANVRSQSNRRIVWKLREARRWADPRLPQFLAIAVQGEETVYEEGRVFPGSMELCVLWMRQVMPTWKNPWGLYLEGFEKKEPREADAIWTQSADLAHCVDEKGRSLATPSSKPANRGKNAP